MWTKSPKSLILTSLRSLKKLLYAVDACLCVCVCMPLQAALCVCVCVCAGREGQLITSRLVWVMNRKRTRSTDPVGPGSDRHQLIEGEGSCLIDQNPAQPGDNTITVEITAQVCAQQHPNQLQ